MLRLFAKTEIGLEGKVALITSGASGICKTIARLFVRHGAKVLIVDFQDELGHSVCKDIGSESISYIHCDVTNESDVEKAVDMAIYIYIYISKVWKA
ncbi:hypothetical protein SO802_030858 [Lithocarpus litseifolius]|uniref:Uncharacterized protein n=1 Tax=Lithocarpus litseifolius TaxID=425828 RepID=A0AAW2BL72_9ROSI